MFVNYELFCYTNPIGGAMGKVNGTYYQNEVKKAMKTIGPAKLQAIVAEVVRQGTKVDDTQVLEAIESLKGQVRYIQTYKTYVLNSF